MKQPVRTISMMADLLLDDQDPPDEAERRDLLERIGGNAKRLGSMIESLLAFSRIDGKLTTEDVDLNEVVAEVREFLARAAEEAGARFEVDDLPVVVGAKTHFRQLFQNLISNALNYGKTGDCLVKITCERATGGGWEISIEDNGPGVPEDRREEVFEVFKRLHRQDEVEGSGLGLSICRKIVDQYQGRLVCDEGQLGGAAMRISLPKPLARAA
jgi:signal transduction histidine kinase